MAKRITRNGIPDIPGLKVHTSFEEGRKFRLLRFASRRRRFELLLKSGMSERAALEALERRQPRQPKSRPVQPRASRRFLYSVPLTREQAFFLRTFTDEKNLNAGLQELIDNHLRSQANSGPILAALERASELMDQVYTNPPTEEKDSRFYNSYVQLSNAIDKLKETRK